MSMHVLMPVTLVATLLYAVWLVWRSFLAAEFFVKKAGAGKFWLVVVASFIFFPMTWLLALYDSLRRVLWPGLASGIALLSMVFTLGLVIHTSTMGVTTRAIYESGTTRDFWLLILMVTGACFIPGCWMALGAGGIRNSVSYAKTNGVDDPEVRSS